MSADQDKLLEEAMRGKQSALDQLLLANYDSLEEHIRARLPAQLRATVDVEDLRQETLIHVIRGFSTFQGNDAAAFRAWVRTIADARRIDAIRKATRQKWGGNHHRVEKLPVSISESFLDLLDHLSDQGRSPSQLAATHEALEALQSAVADLPEVQREVIWLQCLEKLTLEEVAQSIGRTEDAVRGLLHRGKGALKKAMGNSSAWFSKLG